MYTHIWRTVFRFMAILSVNNNDENIVIISRYIHVLTLLM